MATKKPWGGRFEKETDEAVEEFTESVSFDRRLYAQDIRGSIAHAAMLRRCGLIADDEFEQIRDALRKIEEEIRAGEFEFHVPLEDVHMNIEAALIQRIGSVGRKLHTARSRNDQVACDMRMWCRETAEETRSLLRECQAALLDKAEEYEDVIVPGYTHLQRAQPLLLAHVLLAYVEMLQRDRDRLADALKRINVSPLGACALAGTSLPTDPESTARELGFDACFGNSVDAVGDRDFLAEFVFALCLVAMHLSRLAEEWIIWSSREFDCVDLDEAFCTGSSIMPQKKNPDVLELLRGRCGRVYGDLTALLTTLKGLPLAYNRDMQEDKEAVFDAADTVTASLGIAARLVRSTAFKKARIEESLHEGHMDATALAEYLVAKGVPFREAHEMVGGTVRTAAADGVPLSELSLEQFRRFSPLVEEDVYHVLGARNCVENYRSRGSSAPSEVERQIAEWKQRLGG